MWGDVDLEGQTVTFTHQLGRGGERVALKTKRSRRSIEIGAALCGALRQHKMATTRSGDHELVFVNREGRPYDHRNVAGRVLRRAVKRASLDVAPTFHSLRHTHASELIADGWDIESVSSRLGHADVSVTLQVYTHAFEAAGRSDERRRRLEAMEARVEALGGTEGHREGGQVVAISGSAAK